MANSNRERVWRVLAPPMLRNNMPHIDIQIPPEAPVVISSLIHDAHLFSGQHQQTHATPHSAANTTTPENPIHHEQLPALDNWAQIDWEDIFDYTPTGKNIPPQCQAMYIKLLHDIRNHINIFTSRSNAQEAENGWKLLLALLRMMFSNTHRHRVGQQGQGTASLTKAIRRRIYIIYGSKWDELLAPPTTETKRSKSKQQHNEQRDKQDIANIMKQ